jgi:hypothetical protein
MAKERKNTFIKKDGQIPEGIPFKKGDIVTYVDINRQTNKVTQRNIMILDRINAESQCDVFGQVMLTIDEVQPPFIDRTPFGASRVWHNGDKIRPATWFEIVQLIRALYQLAVSGKEQMIVELPNRSNV